MSRLLRLRRGRRTPSDGGLAALAVLLLAGRSYGADGVPRQVSAPLEDDPTLASCACNADVVPPFGGLTQPDLQDVSAVINCVQHGVCNCNPTCDINCDGVVDAGDIQAAQCRFQQQPPSVCCPMPTPPPDRWTTWTDGQPGRSFLDLTLPPGFLGPDVGSFSGPIEFGSKPLNPAGSGDADTLLQRQSDPVRPVDPTGAQGTVPIELVALSLQSVEPITVDCGGALREWNVEVGLSPTLTPPAGTLTATKTHSNGGTFDCTFPVQPLLTFKQRPQAAGPEAPQTGDDTCRGGANNGQPCGSSVDCPGGLCGSKNRFLSVDACPCPGVGPLGLQVTLVDLSPNSVANPAAYNGTVRWAGPTGTFTDLPSPSFTASKLQCSFQAQDWCGLGLIHLYGSVVVPGSVYEVRLCQSATGPCSSALRVDTAKFGDIIPPVNTVNFQDVSSLVAKFQGAPGSPSKTRAKLREPVDPNSSVNFQEVSADVSAFQGKLYKSVFPAAPPICPPPPAPDCGPLVVTLDTGAPPVQPPFQLQTVGTPFVHTINPALPVLVDPTAQFVPGVIQPIPGDLESQQVVTVVAHDLPDLQHTVCLPVPKKACPIGFDYLQTMPCDTEGSLTSFADNPVPAGFFDPGSEPFTGPVNLVGVPVNPGTSGDADTIMARRGVLNFPTVPSTSTVPIEIVALNLVSANPIVVTYNNGNPPEQWNVQVDLSAVAPPMGSLTATKTHRNGGTFDADFFVQPKFTFTRIGGPPATRILDTGVQGIAPRRFRTSDPCDPNRPCHGRVPWVQELAPGSTVLAGSGCFIPGVKEDPTTQNQCCQPTCDEALGGGGAFGSQHCQGPVMCGPNFCAP